MVKQLGISTYFLTLSCADLKWKGLPYIVNKLNNFGLSEEELKKLSDKERCNLLNDNPVLVSRHFQYKGEVFFKGTILDGTSGKTKYYSVRIEFKKNLTHMSVHLYGFSMHQILKMKLLTWSSLRKQ